jgi:serine protease Do
MSDIVSIALTMSDHPLRRGFILLVAGLIAIAVQAAPPSGSIDQQRDPSIDNSGNDPDKPSKGIIPFVVERFNGRNRYPGDEGKNHTMVKAAFRDVVADASAATVVVLADDKRVALGTVVSSDGYIVTKASELRGKLICKLGEKSYDARLVGTHHDTDLALVKIDAKNLDAVRWSRASEKSPAVGSFLATASAVAGGEPLAIGVLSVGPRSIAAASGVLGIAVGESDNGARVDQVFDDTSAARAGLRAGDIITRINSRTIRSRETLIETVGEYRPGDRVRLEIRRGEEDLDISTTLGNRMVGSRRDFQNRLGGDLSERRTGFPQAIQHDTVLRPRECGGPLVDLDGQVVGINIARAERVASYAIPTPIVLDVIEELMPRQVAREPAPTGNRTGRITAARPVR